MTMLQGRRIPASEWNDHEPQPGDYSLKGGRLWVILPTGVAGRLTWPGWTWTEHEDGTITVQPSIFDAPDGWHGYLRHGIFEEA